MGRYIERSSSRWEDENDSNDRAKLLRAKVRAGEERCIHR